MRYRTIKKSDETGGLDRAEVRAAVIAVRREREAALSGSPMQVARETPRVPHGGDSPDEAQ
ncbi:MAG TPA: hypothetical protein VJT67_17455 [Longimicrobiaceae bacterium]|nr:hypothetical protein [Longimicrobiaceae bacterium]